MLADRLQLTVLCPMGPMKILYLDQHSCWPGSLIALYLLRILLTSARPPNFYSSKDVLSSLQQKAEHHGVAPACSPSELLQRIQGRTKGWSKQPWHMGTSIISTWFFCRTTSALHVLHTDTLSLRSSPSTDYLLLCKAQNYADWIHCLIQYFLNWGKMPSKKLHSNVVWATLSPPTPLSPTPEPEGGTSPSGEATALCAPVRRQRSPPGIPCAARPPQPGCIQ